MNADGPMGLIESIWSLNRVHVGPETTQAFELTQKYYPGSQLLRYPSGSRFGALDSWQAPPAWVPRKASIWDEQGALIADLRESPLRLYAYSPSFKGTLTKAELLEHVMTDPKHPDAIPFHFRNQYRHWSPEWGFCLTHNEMQALEGDAFTVDIETETFASDMIQLEYEKRGTTDDYFLLLGHFDHPAQCNDGLAGCIAANEVIRRLQGIETHYSYRALNTVEIIGSVAYCQSERIQNIREALFVAAPGAEAEFAYQQSSQPHNSLIDRVLQHLLEHNYPGTRITPFRELWGNDEIAFETPGVDTRCGLLARHPLPGYHTSLDNFESLNSDRFEEMVQLLLRVVAVIESNRNIQGCYHGLPCFSHPDIDLYLDLHNFSHWDENRQNRYFREMSDAERNFTLSQPQLCNALMNRISPALIQGNIDTLTLAIDARLPYFFVRNYVDMLAEKGMLTLSR